MRQPQNQESPMWLDEIEDEIKNARILNEGQVTLAMSERMARVLREQSKALGEVRVRVSVGLWAHIISMLSDDAKELLG